MSFKVEASALPTSKGQGEILTFNRSSYFCRFEGCRERWSFRDLKLIDEDVGLRSCYCSLLTSA